MSRLPPAAFVATSALLSLAFLLMGAPSASAAEVVSFPDDDSDSTDEEPPGAHSDSDAAPRATVRKRRRTLMGDLNSRWFHIGGGGGVIADPYSEQGSAAGRFIIGGGAYTIGFYGGGGMEVTGSAISTPSVSAVANLGLAVPVPVVHPLVGLRAIAGLHPSKAAVGGGGADFLAPHVGVGLQAGFIIREFDGRPGLRLMIDTGFEYRVDEQAFLPDAFVTLAAVF